MTELPWYLRPPLGWFLYGGICAGVVVQSGLLAITPNPLTFGVLMFNVFLMVANATFRIQSAHAQRETQRDFMDLVPRVLVAAHVWTLHAPEADLVVMRAILASAEAQAKKLGYKAAGPLLLGAAGLEVGAKSAKPKGPAPDTAAWTAGDAP